MGYPTPNNLPTERVCRQIFIPNDTRWLAVFNGVLSLLASPDAWEQIGTLTPEECADAAADIYYQYLEGCSGGEPMHAVGDIKMTFTDYPPDETWLALDGGTYSTYDYPLLVPFLPPNLVNVVTNEFTLPPLLYSIPVGYAMTSAAFVGDTVTQEWQSGVGYGVNMTAMMYWIKALP